MWQSLIPIVVRFLLSAIAKNLPGDQWKAAAKIWVKDIVPGTWFDDAAWAIVEGAWDIILGEVQKQNPLGLPSGSGMDQVFKAVSHTSAAIIESINPKS